MNNINTVDFSIISPCEPSICIPRTFSSITREKVIAVIRDLELGEIDHIDMIQRNNEKGDKFQRIFIHFKYWFSNPTAVKTRKMLLTSEKEIKIIYDEHWFWKISANRSVKSIPQKLQNLQNVVVKNKIQEKKSPSIQIDEPTNKI